MIHRYSGIETSMRCMRKFKLDYIDKLPQHGQAQIELGFGTGLHMALQASLEGDDARHAFETYWQSMAKDYTHEKFRYKDYAIKGREFIRKFEKMHKKDLTPAYLEQTLKARIQGHDFEGTPDFIGLYRGVPSILDFKTSQSPYIREKALSNPQMPLYAELAREALGYDAKQIVYLVFVKSSTSIQTPIVEPLSKELLQRAVEGVILQAETLEKATSHPKNFTACIMGSRVCSRFKTCYGESK